MTPSSASLPAAEAPQQQSHQGRHQPQAGGPGSPSAAPNALLPRVDPRCLFEEAVPPEQPPTGETQAPLHKQSICRSASELPVPLTRAAPACLPACSRSRRERRRPIGGGSVFEGAGCSEWERLREGMCGRPHDERWAADGAVRHLRIEEFGGPPQITQ